MDRRVRVRELAQRWAQRSRRAGDFDDADFLEEQASRGTGESVWPLPDPGPCADLTS